MLIPVLQKFDSDFKNIGSIFTGDSKHIYKSDSSDFSSLLQTHGNALFLILVLGLGGSFQVGFHVTGLSSPSPVRHVTFIISSPFCLDYLDHI